jgi:hypothetical protein
VSGSKIVIIKKNTDFSDEERANKYEEFLEEQKRLQE